MITKIEIKNFRNVGYALYNITSPKTVLYGTNGIGKSNTLNSLMWLLSGTLLTDKYGVGENDITSIIPDTYEKGQHTEVSIWTEAGTKFTKRYKCTFQKGTDRVNGHTTELLINDVLQSKVSDFEEALWSALDYTPTFKTKEIKEVNLFIDPLYALQKLDAEKLRKLLVAIGCSVSNEEVPGYEELKDIAAKYLGDLDKAAADYKKQSLAAEKELQAIETKIETVAGVEEFDPTELNRLNALKEARIKDKLNLKATSKDDAINEINAQIMEYKNKRELEFNAKISELKIQIDSTTKDILLEEHKIKTEQDVKTASVRNEIATVFSEIHSNNIQIENYQKYISNYESDIERYVNEARDGRNQKRDLAVKLAAVQSRTYDSYITCPHCHESFPLSEEGKTQFELDKEQDLADIRRKIERLEVKDKELKEKVYKLTDESAAGKAEMEKLITINEELKLEHSQLENKLNSLMDEHVDTSVLDALRNKKIELEVEYRDFKFNFNKYDDEIKILEANRRDLINNNEESIKLELRAIEDALQDIEDQLSAEYVKRSKWTSKVEYDKALTECVKKLNDIDSMRTKIVHFIQKRIQLLNERAYKKTGIKFIMAEANLGDGTIKEQTVCYATVNGIPFKDVNTAKKIEVGVNFIAKLKEIAVNDFGVKFNKLPVLLDKLESFDSSQRKVESFPTYQLFGTAVSSNEGIEIVNL